MLGFILGGKMELYLWLSIARYDMEWVWRPGVMLLGLFILGTYLYPAWRARRTKSATSGAAA